MDVGAQLKEARLARGLTVPVLASRTRIRAELITAIEAGDFASCGGEVFARGHVRVLAIALGCDPEPLLEELGGAVPASPMSGDDAPLDVWELRTRSLEPASTRRLAALGVVVALGVLAFLWYSQANRDEPSIDPNSLPSVTTSATATVTPEATPTDTPTTDTSTASAEPTPSASSATPTATPTPEPTVVFAELPASLPAPATLVLTASSTSWVRLSNADGVLFEGTMHAGDSQSVESSTDISMRIGNAGGVSVTIGGTTFGPLGEDGVVFSHTIAVA